MNWQGPKLGLVSMAGSIFNVFPPGPGLGQQQDTSSYVARAQAAVAKYDDLLKRMANIGDVGTRNDLLRWISDSTVPGTPAERRKVVGDDLQNPIAATSTDIGLQRVKGLEQMDDLLEAQVAKAEAAFPSVLNPNAPGQIKRNDVFTPTGIVLGVASVLGLLVVPLMLKGNR